MTPVSKRAADRHSLSLPLGGAIWRTFAGNDSADSATDGFSALRHLDEGSLPPRATVPQLAARAGESITYVVEGSLEYELGSERRGVILAGEFQRAVVGAEKRYRARNASRSEWTRFFHLSFAPVDPASDAADDDDLEQRRFGSALRRGALCTVASRDARGGSLRTRQDVVVLSALLEPGQHVVHPLPPDRVAWVHLAHGGAMLGGLELTAGDGVGACGQHAVSLTATAVATELLLIDLPAPLPV
jgi:redox-sensitive bicupin YhaK (pirin superfamily)